MTDFIATEKGVPIRQPSTANLMIDSLDRTNPGATSPFNFQFQRTYSIMNGFFTRIATTEVVLEWGVPNGKGLLPLTVVWATGPATRTVTFQDVFYDVSGALEYVVNDLNTAFSTTVFEIIKSNGQVYIQTSDNSDFTLSGGGVRQLGFVAYDAVLNVSAHPVYNPDLRPLRYIDFTSSQLTYNQDLKDTSTSDYVRDVLCRWYFDWDTPPPLDALGFPILMGYTPFCARRLFNPPKQIKWSPNQPLGNMTFELYNDSGDIIDYTDFNEFVDWLMTLQVSEV